MPASYQSLRQFYFNPNYAGLSSLSAEEVYNPDSVVASLMKNQKNILRYENCSPVRLTNEGEASYLWSAKTKAGVSLAQLIYRLFGDSASSPEFWGDFSGLVTIKNWNGVNIRDYSFLIFDADGFLISTFENTTSYVVNGTLYIFIRNCSKYDGGDFASTVSVVLLRKFYTTGPKECLTNWNNLGSDEPVFAVPVGTSLSTVPNPLSLALADVDKWGDYGTSLYALSLYISSFSITNTVGSGYEDLSDEEIELANDEIAFKLKYVINVNRDLYSATKTDGSLLSFSFITAVSAVSDLGITFTLNKILKNDRTSSHWSEDGYLKVGLDRLDGGSKFYASNMASFFNVEFAYKHTAEDKLELTTSMYSSLSWSDLKEAFVPETIEGEEVLSSFAPMYIPLYYSIGTVPDSSNEHLYPFPVFKAEDVLVWVDGVKLTPYVDYTVVNSDFGKDYPGTCIVYRNSALAVGETDVSEMTDLLAQTFPAASTAGVKHTVRVLAAAPKYRNNFYVGPKAESSEYFWTNHTNVLENNGYEVTDNSELENGLAFYKAIKLIKGTGIVPPNLSVMARDALLCFQAGRYLPLSFSVRDRVILDNALGLENLKTHTDVEIHSFFDDDDSLDAFFETCDSYSPFIDTLLNLLGGAEASYVKAFCEAKYDPSYVTDINSQDYGYGCNFIFSGEATSPIELWLRRNAILSYKTTVYGDSVRFPSTVQTTFDASFNLHTQGYRGNIRVDGSGTSGLVANTMTEDNEI